MASSSQHVPHEAEHAQSAKLRSPAQQTGPTAAPTGPGGVLGLQRMVGNQAVTQLLHRFAEGGQALPLGASIQRVVAGGQAAIQREEDASTGAAAMPEEEAMAAAAPAEEAAAPAPAGAEEEAPASAAAEAAPGAAGEADMAATGM